MPVCALIFAPASAGPWRAPVVARIRANRPGCRPSRLELLLVVTEASSASTSVPRKVLALSSSISHAAAWGSRRRSPPKLGAPPRR